MTNHMNYETEAQSILKEEIADYLSEHHGGRDTDLDAIKAAEHIVTKLAEPHIRAMIAEEIMALLLPQDQSPEAKWLRKRAAQIAKGAQQ